MVSCVISGVILNPVSARYLAMIYYKSMGEEAKYAKPSMCPKSLCFTPVVIYVT